jgi:hypothetical protein
LTDKVAGLLLRRYLLRRGLVNDPKPWVTRLPLAVQTLL